MTAPDLSDRTAIVTGGESGLGRAIALALAKHGAKVVVGDLAPQAENEEQFAKLGIVQSQADLRHESEVRSVVDQAIKIGGGVDILINNVGIKPSRLTNEVTEADWSACADINLKAAFFASKHAIASMRQRGGGAIVNMSSNAGLLPHANDPVYSITKASMINLTKSLALSHGRDRIRVNAVCPGPVDDTGMVNAGLDAAPDRKKALRELIESTPLTRAYNRLQTPKEIAHCVLYLVSDAATMVTGTVISIDGGKSLGVAP